MSNYLHSGHLVVGIAMLAACGNDPYEGGNRDATSEEKILNVYNWADYIGESTIADFEAQTGIKVHYDVLDSSEILETKLLTGRSGYDVVVPTGGRMASLITAGTFQKLDKSKFTNLSNLDPEFMRTLAAYDPGNEYALPYLWATTGIAYNPDKVEKILGTRTIDSWSAVFDPEIASKLKECGITFVNAPETMFELTNIYRGVKGNSNRLEDREAFAAILARVRPYVRYFHSSQFVNDLASGEVCVSISWSYAAVQARTRGAQAESPVEILYVIPKEGAPLFFDMLAIPVDAPHPENAHAFIDYVMEPKVMAGITNVVGAANGNAASLPFVAEALRTDASLFPPEAVFETLYLEMAFPQETLRELNRAWTRIRTGQ